MCIFLGRRISGFALRVSISTARFHFVALWVLLVLVQECLQAFFSAERLRGSNRYHCEGCDSKKEAGTYMGGGRNDKF